MQQETTFILRVQIQEEPNGSYTAMVPELPGLDCSANTRAEALENLSQTVPVYLGSLGDGDTAPSALHGTRILEGGPFLAVTMAR